MKKRLITAIVMAIVLIPFVILTDAFWFSILAGLFVVVATSEMVTMFHNKEEEKFPIVQRILLCLLTLGTFYAIVLFWNNSFSQSIDMLLYEIEAFSLFIVIVMAIIMLLLSLLVFTKNVNTAQLGKIFFVLFYVALGFSAVTILRIYGVRFLIYLFMIAAFTDIFAYLFGVKFGKHKMAPNISPKKSWEGCIAGTVLGSTLASLFAIFYGKIYNLIFFWEEESTDFTILTSFCKLEDYSFPLAVVLIIIITIIASITGQIGDLVASKMKREYEIKDFGKIFPGHGGVLDRFDSTIYLALFLTVVFTLLRVYFPL